MTGAVAEPLLRVENLRMHFPVRRGGGKAVVKAVDDVSFRVPRRAIVGLVGESGSGKTTVGRSVLRLVDPTGGSIHFDGQDLTRLSQRQLRPLRQRMQIIFQDPFASLNPRMTVAEIIGEALTAQTRLPSRERLARSVQLLERVGLRSDHVTRYPHEFSGGQRQRIGIARALAVNPDFIVADEAVSALDVSIQAQVLNLMADLQRDLGLTMLFIAHDLAVVNHLCDEIIVMYLGRIMESGPAAEVINAPAHPYTRALLSAVPVPDPTARRDRIVLKGDVPSPLDAPSGCVFRTRCLHAVQACGDAVPAARPISPGHIAHCIRTDI
jgi:peptide/nickel transport system ATP-binding protein